MTENKDEPEDKSDPFSYLYIEYHYTPVGQVGSHNEKSREVYKGFYHSKDRFIGKKIYPSDEHNYHPGQDYTERGKFTIIDLVFADVKQVYSSLQDVLEDKFGELL